MEYCGIPATLGQDRTAEAANRLASTPPYGLLGFTKFLGRGGAGGRNSRQLMSTRKIALSIIGLALAATLGGCMQETIEPSSQAGWNSRDKQLMSNLPYAQAAIPDQFKRHIVDYDRKEAPGTVVVDSDNKYLYYVLPKGQAIRYGIAVGEEAQVWSGIAKIGRMAEWPAWVPTPGEQERLGPLPAFVTGGPHNPMGARGMYLYSGNKDTLYRIHGTNQPEYIGQAISSGCIRMTNEDAIDLYSRVKVGTIVVVLQPTQQGTAKVASGDEVPVKPY
jgi:lipoprotein-anchoring transpeptidase ErfK/SrfK